MNKAFLNSTVAVCTIFLSVGIATTAQAQDTENTAADSQTEADSSVGTGSAIIVTARRRDERLQDVPIAVSAVSAEQAERTGIDNTEALVIATPSLDFSRSSSFGALPFLRGVGTSFAGAGVESPVAIYVDDVYIASPNANLMSLSNIAGVQVLKGPQGTLFGRNATGGVIQIATLDPEFTPGGKVSATYGNYETFGGSLYLNTPLGENIAFNVAASGNKQADGFGRSLVTDVETQKGWDWNLRGKLLFQLGETTSILISGDYAESRSDFGNNATVAPGTVSLGGATFAGEFNTMTDGGNFTRITQGGVSLKLEQELDFADLVAISAYRKSDMHSIIDQDGSAFAPLLDLDLTSPIETFSQELRLVSTSDGPLDWVVGAYYFHSNSKYEPARLIGLGVDPRLLADPTFDILTAVPAADPDGTLTFDDTQKLNSWSGFAEGTYALLPDTSLTLGVRYTHDSFKLENEGFVSNTNWGGEFTVPGTIYKVSDSFSKLTYRAILDHKFTPDVLGYASYSRGFKSGGYNLPEPGFVNTVEAVRPEVLDAFEVGLKTSLLDGGLTFNVAAFYYDYQDLAVSVTQNTSIIQLNAAEAEIKGIDIDFVARPFDGFQITGGLGLVDSEYKSFPNGPTYTPQVTGGNAVGSADLSGNRTQRAPKFTFSIAPSYAVEVGDGELVFAVSYYHNSGYYSDPENRLRQPGYDLVNGSIGYELDSGLGVRVWAKNLLDERYFSFLQADPFKDAIAYAPPRTYGLTVWKEF